MTVETHFVEMRVETIVKIHIVDILYKLLLFYTICHETANIRKFYSFTEHLQIQPTSLGLTSIVDILVETIVEIYHVEI